MRFRIVENLEQLMVVLEFEETRGTTIGKFILVKRGRQVPSAYPREIWEVVISRFADATSTSLASFFHLYRGATTLMFGDP